MIYSGHFSFDEIGEADKERHGYFTCIVKAGNPELALQKFKQRIFTIRQDLKDPLFEKIHAVYVEDIIEISDTPEEPVVTRFQSSDGPFPKSRTCALPTSDTESIMAYQWVPETDSSSGRDLSSPAREYKYAEPFILFEN